MVTTSETDADRGKVQGIKSKERIAAVAVFLVFVFFAVREQQTHDLYNECVIRTL